MNSLLYCAIEVAYRVNGLKNTIKHLFEMVYN